MTGTPAPAPAPLILHASCVALADRGLLITGPSGAGKSTLCLRLLALGARLVSDDRTALAPEGPALIARCPVPALLGVVEARGTGLLYAPHAASAPVTLVADLSQEEDARLPPARSITIAGVTVPLVLRSRNPHFAEALLLYLLHGRHA